VIIDTLCGPIAVLHAARKITNRQGNRFLALAVWYRKIRRPVKRENRGCRRKTRPPALPLISERFGAPRFLSFIIYRYLSIFAMLAMLFNLFFWRKQQDYFEKQ